MEGGAESDTPEIRLKCWLLALLRFAVTREAEDRAFVLTFAREIDRSGWSTKPNPAFQFFHRTSLSLCDAMTQPQDPRGAAVLKLHLRRIDNVRLRRAVAGALGIDLIKKARDEPVGKRMGLWRGLRR
jgi:hypothetical protein